MKVTLGIPGNTLQSGEVRHSEVCGLPSLLHGDTAESQLTLPPAEPQTELSMFTSFVYSGLQTKVLLVPGQLLMHPLSQLKELTVKET